MLLLFIFVANRRDWVNMKKRRIKMGRTSLKSGNGNIRTLFDDSYTYDQNVWFTDDKRQKLNHLHNITVRLQSFDSLRTVQFNNLGCSQI